MSELRNRLERLAGRGSSRGADEVLRAAMRNAPNDKVAIVPDFDSPDLPVVDDDIPLVTSDPHAHRRGRVGTLVAAFGVAALVGVGALAITSIFGNGGASSPEGAVRQLADAISHKDPLAAVDVLSPTEVRSMRETVGDATHRAADLKIVDNASAPLAGVDLSVDHLQLSSEKLADGYDKVTITSGVLSASTHTAAMSKLLQEAIGHSGAGNSQGEVELAKLASNSDLPTFVVTVRHDGRWYVSPAYTALEYAREAADGPPAQFGSAQAATDLGSATPDAAVTDALHAWQASNWDRLMALAPPDELPVYDYRQWLDQLASESKPDFTIDHLSTTSTTSTVSGDNATVMLDASGTMGSGDDEGKWQVGGTCQNADGFFGLGSDLSDSSLPPGAADGQWTERTTPPTELCLAGDLGNAVPFGLVFVGQGDTAPSSGPVSISVVRENGRWFVSPVTTALKILDSTIQHVDQRSVYTLLGLAYELPPDGNVTLNQPFSIPEQTGIVPSAVFAFDGMKGQKVVGEINKNNFYADGEIYTADGKQVDYVDFSGPTEGSTYPVTLPATGSYRLVITAPFAKGAQLTLWDAKDAPKGLIGSDGSDETCSANGISTSCSSTSSSFPQAFVGPGNVGGAQTCTITSNALKCGSAPAFPLCAKGAPASSNSNCIPAEVAQSMIQAESSISGGGASSGKSATATTAPPNATKTTAP